MRLLFFISFVILNIGQVNAQLFGRNDLGLNVGIMTFHQASLNNSVNTNTRISRVTELDKRFVLGRKTSFETGLGYGTLENLDNRFSSNEHSKFLRIKLGLLLHLPQQYTPTNWSPRKFNPYFKVAYNFDFFDHTYTSVNGNSLGSSLKYGVGAVYRVSHYLGVFYEFSHNQRVTKDYRTFFQHNLGIIINMDQIYLPR